MVPAEKWSRNYGNHHDDRRHDRHRPRPAPRAEAYRLDGEEYIVTSGTGEGYDFAYLASDISLDDIEAIESDYSAWCASHSYVISDLRIAVAYYMQTGERLARDGACVSVLSEEQIEALKIAREMA